MTYLEIAETLKRGRARVPESWRQGRTAYGGLTAGLCVEAARAKLDLPELRSSLVNFTGPVTTDPAFSVRVLRQGRNVTSVGVDVSTSKDGVDAMVGNALLIFGSSRESALDVDLQGPDVTSPEDLPSLMPEGNSPFVPNFIRNFEVRLAGGHRPMSGSSAGRVLCWARHRDGSAQDLRGVAGEAAFVCLGDVLPPAAFAMMAAPVPISSVNWTLNLLREPVSDGGWFLIESVQTAARDGYSSQMMRYWNREGRMVAEGMQAVAVFG